MQASSMASDSKMIAAAALQIGAVDNMIDEGVQRARRVSLIQRSCGGSATGIKAVSSRRA